MTIGGACLLNDVLAGAFALERHLVWRVLMPVGVSLLAIVRRLDPRGRADGTLHSLRDFPNAVVFAVPLERRCNDTA